MTDEQVQKLVDAIISVGVSVDDLGTELQALRSEMELLHGTIKTTDFTN